MSIKPLVAAKIIAHSRTTAVFSSRVRVSRMPKRRLSKAHWRRAHSQIHSRLSCPWETEHSRLRRRHDVLADGLLESDERWCDIDNVATRNFVPRTSGLKASLSLGLPVTSSARCREQIARFQVSFLNGDRCRKRAKCPGTPRSALKSPLGYRPSPSVRCRSTRTGSDPH